MKKLSWYLLILGIFLNNPSIAQEDSKLTHEIQVLLSQIQKGDSKFERLLNSPSDGKIFPYRYFMNGIPKELKGKGIENEFKWNKTSQVIKELSGNEYRVFEDGTICLPIEFASNQNKSEMISLEENLQLKNNEIIDREEFIRKYEVSWLSDKGNSVVIILPIKNLFSAINNNLIKSAGEKFGFFIPGEKIGERDIAVGFYDNYVIRKRQLTRTDIENAFISDLKHSKTKSRENRIGKEVKYLNQISLRLKDNVTEYELGQILKREVKHGYKIYKINALNLIRFSEEEDIFILMSKLKNYKGNILNSIGINFLGTGSSNDPGYQNQWYLSRTNSIVTSNYGSWDEAWKITQGSDDVVVFIIDSGVYLHDDLNAVRFAMGNDYRNLLNIGISSGDSYNAQSYDGHGTPIAGIIAATTGNNYSIAGHNQKSLIKVIKILKDDNTFQNTALELALRDVLSFANSNGNKRIIVNLSLGTQDDDYEVESLINDLLDKNVVIISASGNQNLTNDMSYPAKYEGVIAVGATGSADTWQTYSNYINNASFSDPGVNIVAPGGTSFDGILSLTNDGFTNSDYSGTSFSTPQVTAAVSLMLSVNPDLSVEEIREKLFSTASQIVYDEWGTQLQFESNYNPKVGSGLLQISEAVKASLPEEQTFSGGSHDEEMPTTLSDLPQSIGNGQVFLVKKEGDGSQSTYYSLDFNKYINSGGVLIVEKNVKIVPNGYRIEVYPGGTLIYEDGAGISTGIEDAVIFYPFLNLPNENLYLLSQNMGTVYYSTNFVDQEPLGDYLVGNKTYEMCFYHAGGKYIYSTKTTPVAQQTVSFSITDLPTNLQWERDQDGMIVGKITVSAVDNSGYSHENHLNIGINGVPNKPILGTAKPGNGKIKLTYTSNGAASYKINYGTTPQSQPNFVNSSEPECTISGLQNRTTYYFTIEGINSTGTSLSSDVITRTPLTTSGVLAQNETWPGNGNPNEIELEGDLTISGNTTLTITGTAQNNITLRIPSSAKITVNNSSKIISSFTVFGRLDLSAWNSLYLNGNTNSFTNCLFDGGGSSNQSSVNIRSTGNTFTNCTFSNNYYGIISYWVSSGVRSGFTVNNCIFENNRHGLIISYANASVSNSIFRDNTSSGIYVWGSTVNTFSNNKIFSNVTKIANEGNRGGLELMAGSILYMDNNKLNRVWNNKSHEIYLDTDSKLYGSTGKNSIKDAENGYSATGKYIYSLSQTQVGENFINWTVPMSSNYWGGVPASGMFYGSVDFSSHLSIDPTGTGPNPTKVAGEGKQITSVLSSEMYQRTIPDESYSTSGGKGDKNLKPRMVEIRNWLRKNPDEIRNARFANEYYSLLLQDPDDQTQEKLPAKILIKELKERLKTLKSSQNKLPDAVEAAIQSSGQTAMQIEVDYLISQGRYTEAKTAISENLPFIEIKDIFISMKLSQMALAEREGKFTEALGILNEIKSVEPDANIKDFEGYTAPNYEIAESNLLSLTGLSSLKTPVLQKPVASQTEKVTPSTIQIHQNYPNPFNPTTTIPFKLSKNGRVKIQVFNMTGQILSTLTDQTYEAGEHSIPFNAANLASGVYLYKVTLDGKTYTNKMTVLK